MTDWMIVGLFVAAVPLLAGLGAWKVRRVLRDGSRPAATDWAMATFAGVAALSVATWYLAQFVASGGL
ncbi:MAG: hypothetical protein ACAH11_14860 [Sphingomonas sp.]